MIYEIIKRGDKYFPRMRNEESGLSYGAWSGYYDNYDDAMEELKKFIEKEEIRKQLNKEEVLFSIRVKS